MKCLNGFLGAGALCGGENPKGPTTGLALLDVDGSFSSFTNFGDKDQWITKQAAGDVILIKHLKEIELTDTEESKPQSGLGWLMHNHDGIRGRIFSGNFPDEVHKELLKLSGLEFRVVELDMNGNIIGVTLDGTEVTGAKTAYFRVYKQNGASGDATVMTRIELQYEDWREQDEKGVYVTPSWLASSLQPVKPVTLTLSAIAANVFTATVDGPLRKISGSAYDTVDIVGLVAANFKIIKASSDYSVYNSASDYTVTAVAGDPNTYTIDGSVGGIVANDTVQVIPTATKLYRSAVGTLSA